MPNEFQKNIDTSNRLLGRMIKYPTDQFQAFADTPRFISENIGPDKLILFLLHQELLYAQNIRMNHIVNPEAIQGLIPFSGGRQHTALDYFILPGLDVKSIERLEPNSARRLAAIQSYNLGQLEADFLTPNSPVDKIKSVIRSFVNNLLGGSVNRSVPTSKSGKSIEEYLSVNKDIIKKPDRKEEGRRWLDLNSNITTLDEQTKQEFVNRHQFPFYFKSLNYEKESLRKYIMFQGIINSLGESFIPNWNSEDVFGRPHPLWIYANVNRTISIEFMIIAKKFSDLDAIRERADWLAKHTYPDLVKTENDYVHYRSGPLLSITVGDLFKNLNGFITSLDFDWNAIKRWELQKDHVFPQGLKVNMRFNVLEEKLISNTDSDLINVYKPFE